MQTLRKLLARLKGSVRRRREDALLEEEIAAHIAMLRERYESLGMTAEEAERRARVQFGNPTVLQERQRAVRGFLAPPGNGYARAKIRKSDT